MSVLSDKIKKARQTKVPIGSFFLTVRRPTNLEMLEFKGLAFRQREILERFVVDWDGFKQSDLFPGGDPEPVPFDHDAYKEWIADHPEYWNDVVAAIVDSYKEHEAKSEELAKN